MALYTEDAVRSNIRVKDGKRVFYLAAGDRMTPAARQWLRQEHVEVLPAAQARVTEFRTLFGATLQEKPEHMTHLSGNLLVMKDHPRIRFRGMIDTLEAELLLCMHHALQEQLPQLHSTLQDTLQFVRQLIPADVLDEPVKPWKLGGMTPEELRERSHFPQKYYDQPHFMPDGRDSLILLQLNRVRTVVRQTELAAFDAFRTRDGAVTREDILMALNRLSSLIWILMIQLKAKENTHG